jgi:formylglycine-generating enzyme required for sulfatase activity/tRNA A-37 threonylcarbamoyl transferase component Bud32
MSSDEPGAAQQVLDAWEPTFRGNPAGLGPGQTFRPPAREWVGVDTEPGLELLEPLGEGGMAVVFRARQRRLARAVAVKQVRAELGPEAQGRFFAEAMITARLDHPNVVPVHDLVNGEHGTLSLAMKLVRGRGWDRLLHPADDADRIAAGGLDTEAHLEILLQVANAVAYAHERGIAHCDLKPANVMVGEFGEVLVMDWGLAVDFRERSARELGDELLPHRSALRHPCGTPLYMPPELALGMGSRVGPWTDVFLLGAILHEILGGRPPNAGDSLEAILRHAARGPDVSLPAQTPEPLRALCLHALRPVIGERLGSAPAFVTELKSWLKHRESLSLTAEARALLERQETAEGHAGRATRYEAIAGAIAGCRQARLLWADNPEAGPLELQARVAMCGAAVRAGDLGLAREQLVHLPVGPDADRLGAEVAEAERRVARAAQWGRWTRRGLYASAAAVGAALILALVGWRGLREQQQVLVEVADTSEVDALLGEPLPPAIPASVPWFEAWLRRAEAVLAAGRVHGERLSALEAETGTAPVAGCDALSGLPRLECGLRRDLLRQLAPLADERVPQVKARLEFARTVERRSWVDAAERWRAAVRAVSSPDPNERSAPYREAKVELAPQLGLVPLGPDPESGLEEFVHLQSGSEPSRRNGRLQVTAESGVVLVLLPGGTFQMGSSPQEGPNRDPTAVSSAAPVHPVALAPFFISKYELTQAQYLRATGRNPSAYAAGQEHAGERILATHPVEQLTWEEAAGALEGIGLRLPTEAQWEYAARGGTSSAWWWGERAAAEDLSGCANLADEGSRAKGPASWSYVLGLTDGHLLHAPVGTYRGNPFGLHDVAGNVWEWCEDGFVPYTVSPLPGTGLRLSPAAGGTVSGASAHVFRGGGFRASAVHLKSADRYQLYSAGYRGADVGVRPALTLVHPAR